MSKKICITFFLLFIIIATVLLALPVEGESQSASASTDYLRIHVRANSNLESDQQVKYKVKDRVVGFITPYIKECVSKQAAIEVIGSLTEQIEEVCEEELTAQGYSYGAKAEIRQEKFPTRVYGELTLQEDVYDALIIELGTGKGDNWWCVIYPPLCFTSASADVEYRSIIYDIINKFKNK
ncbi:MAG: stage II sporulation protein R [Candidatus Coproplasma sp.]